MDPILTYAVALLGRADTAPAVRDLAVALLAYRGPSDGRRLAESALLAAAYDILDAATSGPEPEAETPAAALANLQAAQANLAALQEISRLYDHLLAVIGREQLTDPRPLALN